MRSRIPFAVANLKVAAASIRKHPSTYCVAFLMLIVQIVWVFVWAFAFLGLTNHLGSTNANLLGNGAECNSNSDCASGACRLFSSGYFCYGDSTSSPSLKSTSYVAYFFMLVSFYWGLTVSFELSYSIYLPFIHVEFFRFSRIFPMPL